MDEYIKRKDALCRFTFENGCRIPEVNIDNFQNSVPLKDIKRVLLEIPSADVVEVVRCGECKFYSPVEGDIGDCEREDILYLNVNKSDFCSYGVRKEDNRNE